MAQIRKSRVTSRTNGTVAIEYGFILPVLLLFTLGIMDAGRLLWTYMTLYRATEAAARCGAVNSTLCGTSGQIAAYAVTQAWGLTIASSAFTVTTPTCGVQVRGTYTFQFVIPWFSPIQPLGSANTIHLSATACDTKQY